MSKPLPGEIVIEIDLEQHSRYTYREENPFTHERKEHTEMVMCGNGHLMFRPVERQIRSRLVPGRMSGAELQKSVRTGVHYIPGERIHVDIEKRIGRITDPLADEDNRELYQSLVSVSSRSENPWPVSQPTNDQVVELKSDTALWTWLFHMRQIVDRGCTDNRPREMEGEWFCRPVQNVTLLPSMDEINKSGKARILFPEGDPGLSRLLDEVRKKSEAGYDASKAGFITPELMAATTW